VKHFVPAAFLVILLVCGCGKVGDPRPPKMRTPSAVSDLKVSQNENNIVLAWTNPLKYVDGSNATDLKDVHILRDGKPIETVPVSGPGKPQTYTLPVAGSAGTTLLFSLEVATQRGKTSSVSNEVRTPVVDVPGVVLNLRGVMDQHRIRLDWDPPAQTPALAEVYIIRREDGAFAPEAVTETHWDDKTVEAGKTYSYIVSAARSSVPPVPGPSSPKITVIAIDTKPPAAPTGLQPPVISDSGAFLHWDRSTDEDSGYKVYRSDNPAAGDGGWVWLGNAILTITSFTDGSYRPGSFYSVTAVDDAGNESDKSPPVRAP
jgi:hypothetical protein